MEKLDNAPQADGNIARGSESVFCLYAVRFRRRQA